MYKKTESADYSKKLDELERDSWVLLDKKYKKLSFFEYNKLIEDWDIYYKIVREDSPMYPLYKDSYKAMFIDRDMDKVKKNAVIAREWLVNGKRINSPSEEDPRAVNNKPSVVTYYRLKNVKKSSSFEI